MKIVFVEDEDMLRHSLSFFLKNNGFEVVDFDNGLDAIDYIKSDSSIDLVITDLNLPFAGGKQIVLTCKKELQTPLKVVILTSSGIESTEIELLDLGADDLAMSS